MVATPLPSFRASSGDRVLECPGSVSIEAVVEASCVDIAVDQGHAVTWAGTWCHYQAAKRLIEEYGAIGILEPLRLPSAFKPSGYDEWVVEFYLKKVLEVIPRNFAIFVEREFAHTFLRFRLTGHIDCYAISPDESVAIVNDLKRGFDPVDIAEENWQLAIYGVLLKLAHPRLKKILLRIHQPSQPDRVTEACVENLDTLVAFIESKFNGALDDPYLLQTGKGCKYCTGWLVCPAFREEILDMVKRLTKEEFARITGVADTEELAAFVFKARKLVYPIQRLADTLKTRLSASPGVPVKFDAGSVVALEVDGDRTIEEADYDFTFETLSAVVGAPQAIKAFKPSVGRIEEVLDANTDLPKTSKKPDVETCQTWIKTNLGGVIKRPKTVEVKWL